MSEQKEEQKSHAFEKLHRKLGASKKSIDKEIEKAFGRKAEKLVVVRLDFKDFDSMVARQRENVEKMGGTYLGSYIKIAKEAKGAENLTIIHRVVFESYYESDDKYHLLTWRIDRVELDGLPKNVDAELQQEGKVTLTVEM